MEWNGLALHPAHPAIMKPDEPIIVSSMPEFDALMSSARTSYRIASSHRQGATYRRIDGSTRGRAVVAVARSSFRPVTHRRARAVERAADPPSHA